MHFHLQFKYCRLQAQDLQYILIVLVERQKHCLLLRSPRYDDCCCHCKCYDVIDVLPIIKEHSGLQAHNMQNIAEYYDGCYQYCGFM